MNAGDRPGLEDPRRRQADWCSSSPTSWRRSKSAAHLLDVIGNWLPVLTVVLGAIGVLLARRRRRALVTTYASGAASACLILAIGLVVIRRFYLDHLPAQVQSPAAAAAVFDTLLRFLRVSLRTTLVLGVVVAFGAYLVRVPAVCRVRCAERPSAPRTPPRAGAYATGSAPSRRLSTCSSCRYDRLLSSRPGGPP